MGVLKSGFHFMAGIVCGVYVAQNYSVPNINTLINMGMFMAKSIEQSYRKPKKRDDD